MMNIGLIFLAGGTGKRMQNPQPKQFLGLGKKPIFSHSFEIFEQLSQIKEIVVVIDPHYEAFFVNQKAISFAVPGERRQDSVYSGLKKMSSSIDYVCVHDAARPFIDIDCIERLIHAATETGAATLGLPLKFTVKESFNKRVKNTLDRSNLWEIQTPQIVRKDILEKGFEFALKKNITVTDDVSLAELVDCPVSIVEGSDNNIKITTPQDLKYAEFIFQQNLCIVTN